MVVASFKSFQLYFGNLAVFMAFSLSSSVSEKFFMDIIIIVGDFVMQTRDNKKA